MRHVISALVMNEPGVLANVAGMFAARGFNIDSLVVGRTEKPELSRMTVVVDADENTLDQVRKQLAKLVPVVEVIDFKDFSYIERDLALITVGVNAEQRHAVIEIVTLFRAAFPDQQWLIEDLIAEGDRVVARSTMTGTHTGDFFGIPASGKSVRMSGVHIVRIQDGRIAEHWGNNDDLGLMRQIGVIPG